MSPLRNLGIAAAAAAMIVGAAAAPAAADRPFPRAGGADSFSATGVCSGDSTWTLSGRSRALRVLLTLEVVGGEHRDKWRYRLAQNGEQLARGKRRTRLDVPQVQAEREQARRSPSSMPDSCDSSSTH